MSTNTHITFGCGHILKEKFITFQNASENEFLPRQWMDKHFGNHYCAEYDGAFPKADSSNSGYNQLAVVRFDEYGHCVLEELM